MEHHLEGRGSHQLETALRWGNQGNHLWEMVVRQLGNLESCLME
jgi:hypothetical protein